MPLSEFYGMARGILETSQQKPSSSSADISHLADDNEFVELVWENGQIMMKGQSNRAKRNIDSHNSQSQIPRHRDRDSGLGAHPRMGKFGAVGTALDDFTAMVPSSALGLDPDDEVAPWLNCDDPLQNNCCPEFLPEISTVTVNDPPDRKNSPDPMFKVVSVGSGHWSFEGNQTPAPFLRSGTSNVISNSVSHVGPTNAQASSGVLSNSNSGIVNFSHFCRPVNRSHGSANTLGPLSSSGFDIAGSENNGKVVSVSNSFKSSNPINVLGNGMSSASQPNLFPETVNTRTPKKSETFFQVNAVKIDEPPNKVDSEAATKEKPDGEKIVEPVIAPSSVCSGNNPEQASNDQDHNMKRSRETDDSEGRSEDAEEESVGTKKAAPARGGKGAKRSRAAEVHNLSERRRRDRINEKMRALQELIPNCNKVDKASMLDEAIEYLKTLQLQVQIMSMGAGLYMPHMMLPTGVQHVLGHVAHYPPMMGVGVGMGMGYGMGMLDMNGGVRLHGQHPMPFSRPANFHMPGPQNHQAFGHGGPGLSVVTGPSNSVMVANNTFGSTTAHVDVLNSIALSNSDNLIHSPNLRAMCNPGACDSLSQTSSQVASEGFLQSPSMCKSDHAQDHRRLTNEIGGALPS